MAHIQRTALITGGNRGLGLETARHLKALGYRVLLTSRDPAKGRSAAQNLGVDFHPLDVASPESIAALVSHINSHNARIDVLVNNAAVLPDENLSLREIPAERLRATLETNSLAPLWLARACLPAMEAQGYGRIVNVSSGMGQIRDLDDYASAYRLSKLLLNGMTRILAETVRHPNVLINAVCPGWVKTDMGGPNAPRSLEQGVRGIIWAATLPEGGPQGGFFRDGKRVEW
jgi:NAD(P)-dependent dehydrogenase (short-subunit alcohol dehydrogenase family)